MAGRAGQRVAGRYFLQERIGVGGMGAVWRATDQRLQVDVALKEVSIPAESGSRERAERVARARREALNAARLRGHPGIVTIHDALEEDGLPWIVMALVSPARSVADLLKRRGGFRPAEAATIGAEVADALAFAHARGVIHRDIKPGNILITENGQAVVTDFGIAAHQDDSRLTAGAVVGTMAYIAPERFDGRPADGRSDVFSLGVTLYQMVEEVLPFEATTTAALIRAILLESPRPSVRAGPLRPVLEAMLSKPPLSRPDAAASGRLLAAVAAGPPATTPAPPVPTPAPPGGPGAPWAPGPPGAAWTQGAQAPGTPGPRAGVPPAGAEGRPPAGRYGPGGTHTTRSGNRRVAAAAVAVAVVLAVAGIIAANTGGGKGDHNAASTTANPSSSGAPTGTATGSGSPSEEFTVSPSFAAAAPGVSRYSETYYARLTGIRQNGFLLSVAFTAVGASDLRDPRSSCVSVTSGSHEFQVFPVQAQLPVNTSGRFAGTLTFPLAAPGTYSFRYSCQRDYSAVALGQATMPTAGTGVYSDSYFVTVLAVRTGGGRTVVLFAAAGKADLRDPATSCAQSSAGNRKPAVRLTLSQTSPYAATYVGVMRFEGTPPLAFVYSCSGYSAVTL